MRSAMALTSVGATGLPRIVTVTRPAAVRLGPSETSSEMVAVGLGCLVARRVRVHPLRETSMPVPLSSAAAWIEHDGFSSGESR